MRRREFTKGALMLAAASLAAKGMPAVAEAQYEALKSINSPCGRKTGTWVDYWMFQAPALLSLIAANFNLGMIGTLKWEVIRNTPDLWNYNETDQLVSFCQKHGMAIHGHNLCWNTSNPAWLLQTLTPANAESMLWNYITTVMTRYKGVISSYDVVNEPIAVWMGRSDGLYEGPWLSALGPEYIDIAFHAAAAADPSALRVLNIEHVEQPYNVLAQTKTLQLIEALLSRGVPVQAIGFESHLFGMLPCGSDPYRDSFVKSVRSLGLKIVLSELDINDTLITGTIAERDAAVAACYQTYLESIIATANPEWISFFCYTDENNWYDTMSGPQYTRADGLPHRPGLLDVNYAAKPALASVISAFQAACK